MAISQDEELLVANRASNEIVKIDQTVPKKVIASNLEPPIAALEVANGDLYVSNYGGGIIRVTSTGNEDFSRNLVRPGVGMVTDEAGQLFFPDNGDDTIRQLLPDGSTKIVYEGVSGAVALLYQNQQFYVSSWGAGSISILQVD